MVSPLLLAILATEKVDINREGGSPKEQKRGKGKSKSEGSREHTWLRASGVGLQEGLNPEQVPRDNGIIMRFSFVSAPDGARHVGLEVILRPVFTLTSSIWKERKGKTRKIAPSATAELRPFLSGYQPSSRDPSCL